MVPLSREGRGARVTPRTVSLGLGLMVVTAQVAVSMEDADRSRAGTSQRVDGTVRRTLCLRGRIGRGWRRGGYGRTAGRECTAALRDGVAYGAYFRVGTPA